MKIFVGPCHGHLRQGRVESVRAEEAGGRGFGGEVGVEAQHDIGLGAGTFELQAVEHGHAVARAPPSRCVQSQSFSKASLILGRPGPIRRRSCHRCRRSASASQRRVWPQGPASGWLRRLSSSVYLHSPADGGLDPGHRRSARNPSAGMIRIRFSGLRRKAPLSQSCGTPLRAARDLCFSADALASGIC